MQVFDSQCGTIPSSTKRRRVESQKRQFPSRSKSHSPYSFDLISPAKWAATVRAWHWEQFLFFYRSDAALFWLLEPQLDAQSLGWPRTSGSECSFRCDFLRRGKPSHREDSVCRSSGTTLTLALSRPANLLVVILLVGFYKAMSGQSTEILPRIGPTHPRLAEEAGVQPGRYD